MKRAERRALARIWRAIGMTDVATLARLDGFHPPRWPIVQQVRNARERIDSWIGPAGGDKAARQHAYGAMRRLKAAKDAREQHWQQTRDDAVRGWILGVQHDRALLEAMQAQQDAGLFLLAAGVAEPVDLVRQRIEQVEGWIALHKVDSLRRELPGRIIARLNRERNAGRHKFADRVKLDVDYAAFSPIESDYENDIEFSDGFTPVEFESVTDDDDDELIPGLELLDPDQAAKVITDWVQSLDAEQILRLARLYRNRQ